MPQNSADHKTPHARPPLARMMQIHEALLGNTYPNAAKLSKRFEVSTKTAHRDLEFMRDQLGLPIEYDSSLKGFYYTEHVDSFPTVQVTEGEIFALMVAQKAIEAYRGTPFEEPLHAAFRKLSDGLRDRVSFSSSHLDAPVSFKPIGVSVINEDIFQAISHAVMKSLEISFHYQKLGSSESEERHVQPHHLAHVDNQWYVITFDLNRKSMRTFALPRISKLKVTKNHFTPNPDFSAAKHLKNSLGAFAGEVKHRVVIRFDEFAARLVKEKTWHPAQSIKELPDGGVEFEIKLTDLWEIERWILSWGYHAKVIKPKRLVDRIKSHLSQGLSQY